MEVENVVSRSITAVLHSLDIEREQMERESGFTQSVIDEPHSSNIQGDQMEG